MVASSIELKILESKRDRDAGCWDGGTPHEDLTDFCVSKSDAIPDAAQYTVKLSFPCDCPKMLVPDEKGARVRWTYRIRRHDDHGEEVIRYARDADGPALATWNRADGHGRLRQKAAVLRQPVSQSDVSKEREGCRKCLVSRSRAPKLTHLMT